LKCEKCHDSGFYGDNGPGRKGNTEYTRCDCQEDKLCTIHHACDCIRERLDRIDTVWQKYRHMDTIIMDSRWLLEADFNYRMMRDMWKAIRRS